MQQLRGFDQTPCYGRFWLVTLLTQHNKLGGIGENRQTRPRRPKQRPTIWKGIAALQPIPAIAQSAADPAPGNHKRFTHL